MIKKYVKKPIPIEAMQWTGMNRAEIANFTHDARFTYNDMDIELYIHTLEGDMHANVGDYIVKGIKGEVWVVRKDIFLETYEEVME